MNETPAHDTFHAGTPPAIPAQPPAEETPENPTLGAFIATIRNQIQRAIIGQDDVIDHVLAALLAGGHVLLEGKPGLGKTHLVNSLAATFGGEATRIQFTPDLMPSDVTGFRLFDMKSQTFQLRKGPVFTNLLLADEINRAPAKTQAALLEVMQERQVTIDGETLRLAPPFMTLATQNPIEHEGTYPLPEAQLDRFLMKILIDYPGEADEARIVSIASGESPGGGESNVEIVASQEQIVAAQQATATVTAVPEVVAYAVAITRATRDARTISLGAGTRGAISLVRAAKAFAAIEDRGYITPDDVKRAALPVLRHRVQLTPEVTINGQWVDDVLTSIVDGVPAPRH